MATPKDPLDIYAKIQGIVRKEATDIATAVYNKLGTQRGVAKVPVHSHNNVDSPSIPFDNIFHKQLPIHWTLPGTSAATAGNFGVIWTAPFPGTVIAATEVHQTAASAVGSVTLQIEKLTGTTASGAGIDLLVTPFDLEAAANTVQEGSLIVSSTSSVRDCTFKVGDRLGLVLTGTPTSLNTMTVVITVQY